MKVTLVSTWSIVNSSGGAERVYCWLANALVARGHSVTCICFDFESGKPAFYLDDKVKFVNAGIGVMPPFYLAKFARNLLSLFSFDRGKRREKRLLMEMAFRGRPLIDAVRESEPDVVISFRPEDTYAINCYGGMKVPIVTMSHNSTDRFLPGYSAGILKKAVEKSAAVQVLMPNFVDELKKIIPAAKVAVIPNPVPQFDETSNRSMHEIINVGRLSEQKHQDLLIEAFALLANKYPDWYVKIWGGGEPRYEVKLSKLIERRGLKKRVFLCGTTQNVEKELSRASIFAFPSRWEGFSLALTEAMSMGLPTVGLRGCPSVNKLVRDNDNGFLCDETPLSYAMALERLMKSESVRIKLGDSAKADMAEYCADKICDKWEKLLLSVAEM